MDQRERLVSSALLGGGLGAVVWLLHGVSVVIGLPRLLAYAGIGTTIAFVIDYVTTPEE